MMSDNDLDRPVSVVIQDPGVQSRVADVLAGYVSAVRTFSSGSAFLSGAASHDSGCVVARLDGVGSPGLELQQSMRERWLTAPIVFVAGHAPLATVVRAMQLGAATVLDQQLTGMADAVEAALLQDARRRDWLRETLQARTACDLMSPRQLEVLGLLAQGLPNKVIAGQLFLSPRTVEKHRQEIFRRTATHSVAQLAMLHDRAARNCEDVFSLAPPQQVLAAAAPDVRRAG